MSTSSFNRHGAVDLSSLAAKAKQPTAPAGGGASGGPVGSGASAGASYVVELTERTFESEAIRASLKHPVVVELYSPRVSTGQQLSDALAELAAEAAGKFLVGRLNVDVSPQIVQALGVSAVPTVIGLIGGQLAPLFQGVVSKEQARTAIDQLLKAAVANGIVGRAEPVGSAPAPDEPEPVSDPRFAAADAALEAGDFVTAEAEFDKLLQANPGDAEAKAGKAQAGLLARTAAYDPQQVLAAAAAPNARLEDHLAAADIELVTGSPEAAFARLVALIRENSGSERDRVRTRLLELFETLGSSDPRVLKARRDLMSALF